MQVFRFHTLTVRSGEESGESVERRGGRGEEGERKGRGEEGERKGRGEEEEGRTERGRVELRKGDIKEGRKMKRGKGVGGVAGWQWERTGDRW